MAALTTQTPVLPLFDLAIAEIAPSTESPKPATTDLLDDAAIRNAVAREYIDYFITHKSLLEHWLSILNDKGFDNTLSHLRRVVDDFILRKTEDAEVAKAYRADNGQLFNFFIDDLAFCVLKEIQKQDPATNAIKLDLSPSSHVGEQLRYILKSERIRWPEGVDDALFLKTRVRILDIRYGKNRETLVHAADPNDSFFTQTPNGKYWTVASLRDQSKTSGPIILDFNNSIMDGHHRLIDAAWAEADSIDAYVRIKPKKKR
jgi:hypothetical protein